MQQIQTQKGYKKEKFLFEFLEIPESWIIKKLIDLCNEKPQYGAAVSALPKNTELPRYIRITDLNEDGSLKIDEWKSISEKDSKPYLLAEEEILFARTGATVGKTYLYNKKHGKCAFAGYLIRFKPDKNKLNPEFLFHYTHSSYYWKWLNSIQTEGVQPNVNAEQYSNMLLLCPPIQEQQKISSILSNVDELIQKTEEIIEQTQRLKNGLINKLVTKGLAVKENSQHIISDKYKFVKLTDVVDINPSYKIEKNKEYQYIEMAAIDEKTKTIKYFSKRKPSSGYAVFKNNDTLFARITPCTENGKTCLVTEINGFGLGSTELIVLSPKKEILPKFLCYYCQTDKVRSYAISQMGGATGRQRVPYKIFKEDLFIVIPDKKNQQQIVNTLCGIEDIIKFNIVKKEKIQNLKKGLMQQLLTGKIRVKV